MEDTFDSHWSSLDAAMWACARELEETKIINEPFEYFFCIKGRREQKLEGEEKVLAVIVLKTRNKSPSHSQRQKRFAYFGFIQLWCLYK